MNTIHMMYFGLDINRSIGSSYEQTVSENLEELNLFPSRLLVVLVETLPDVERLSV